MAYQNFIPAVWAEGIERDLDRDCVFTVDCNRKYEGAVKNKGDSVKILGVGKPTIFSIAKEDRNNDIPAVEEVEDTSCTMYINQIRAFNYMVGDIDKAQAVNGIMEALDKETSEGLANEVDKYIAGLAVDESVAKLYKTATQVTKENVLTTLDGALQSLYENDVSGSTKIVVDVSPRFYTLFKQAYISKDTDNSEMMKNGRVSMYGNAIIKMSNNVHKTEGGAVDNIMIRTQRAIAYVHGLTKVVPYSPERKFADAVKGFILFDAKVVRPKEIININVRY